MHSRASGMTSGKVRRYPEDGTPEHFRTASQESKRMWRMGVPVATPITASDWLAACRTLTLRNSNTVALEAALRERFDVSFVRVTSSGRVALFLTLRAMQQLSACDEVVVPAFVCPSVGRAVVKAGLKPVLCD